MINVNSGTPTASISANSGDNNTFLTGTGNLGTTNNQTLTLGGNTTGDVFINENTTVSGNGVFQGTGGVTLSGAGSDLAFTGGGNNLISSTGTLQLGAVTLTGTVTGGSQTITALGILDFGTGNVSITGTTVGLTTDIDLLSLAANALTVNGTGTFTSDVTLNGQSDIRLADSDSSNYTGFQSPAALGSNIIYTLPTADGSLNYALTTNGSGTLSWNQVALGTNYWKEVSGSLLPINETYDLVIGSSKVTKSSKEGIVITRVC